jgi:hypothetical protein
LLSGLVLYETKHEHEVTFSLWKVDNPSGLEVHKLLSPIQSRGQRRHAPECAYPGVSLGGRFAIRTVERKVPGDVWTPVLKVAEARNGQMDRRLCGRMN